MNDLVTQLRSALGTANPFEGFDAGAYAPTPPIGTISPAMQELFARMQPRVLVEVGSWKGESACGWAGLMRQHQIDGAVVCIDTWLGSIEHYDGRFGAAWDIRPYLKHGYPTLYYQFLANVLHQGAQDHIVPVPTPSLIGARWLASRRVQADMVYVDGSHDEDDVYADLNAYWRILRPNGVLCGDDFSIEWYPVICGVNRFVRGQEKRGSKPICTTRGADRQSRYNML